MRRRKHDDYDEDHISLTVAISYNGEIDYSHLEAPVNSHNAIEDNSKIIGCTAAWWEWYPDCSKGFLMNNNFTMKNFVEVEDFGKALPYAITHSAAKIISRIKDGGEKTTQTLKSLCWRSKGIHVEEATLVAIDTLKFRLESLFRNPSPDIAVCISHADYGAERQVNDLLFPGIQQKGQISKQPHQKEC